MAKNPRADRNWQESILARERSADFGFTLGRIKWDIFSTLTFQGTLPRPSICYGQAWRWLREVAEVCGVPYKSLLIALRGEHGESRGRFHFHCLVGGTSARNIITLAHRAEHLWKVANRGARVEVRPYDSTQAGAEYIAKCLGANAYELNKFNLADSVTLSASVYRVIEIAERIGDRHCRMHTCKNGGAMSPPLVASSC